MQSCGPWSRCVVTCALIAVLGQSGVRADSRTWIGGNVDWVDGGSAANWSPADEPDADDEAIFNSNNTVNLGSNNSVNFLTMSGGIDLSTNGFDLLVDGLVQLSGASTRLFIGGPDSEINADEVAINSGGTVELTGGTLVVDDEGLLANGVVFIDAGGSLVGHGTVTLADSPLFAGTLFNNNGTLTALTRVSIIGQNPPANTLTINAAGSTQRIDLDGLGETGVVNVNRNQTLDINGTLSDAFNGTLTMTQNTTLDVSTAWTLGTGGAINVDNGEVIAIPGVPKGTANIAGGALSQTGGTLSVVDGDGELTFDSSYHATGGTFTNFGHVTFNASSSIVLPNFDFDAGDWTVQNNALLSINVTDYDPGVVNNAFDATITLNNGDLSIITGDPKFVMNGTLNMSSTSGITVWDGEPIDIGNDAPGSASVNVTGTTFSRFSNPVTFKSDAVVNVASDAVLLLSNTVNFDSVNGGNNAQFIGSGQLWFNGAVNVNEATILDMVGGTVDLDGSDDAGDQIMIQANLEINAQTLSSFGRANAGGGVNLIDVNALTVGTSGALTVNLDNPNDEWTLNPEGVLRFFNSNNLVTMLAGSDVNLNGTVSVTGAVGTAARVDVGGTVNILTAVPDGGFLLQGGSLADPNTIAGGTINGPGALQALSGRALQGFGTINAGIDFGGTAQLVADNGTLTVNGTIFDVGTIAISDDGTLSLGSPFSTGVTEGGVVMSGGTLQGAQVTTTLINKSIRGTGTIFSAVVNEGAIEAQGGTLLLTNTSSDWDGSFNLGHLRASGGGTLQLVDDAAFGFTGSVIAVENSRVFTDGFALDFNLGSTIILTQGTYESTNSTDVGGTVVIGAGAPSTIKVQVNRFLTFESTSSTTLNGNLRLENNNINIEAGATFSGGGALVVPDGSHLIVDSGATVNALLLNEGAFRPSGINTTGAVTLKDYVQTADGELIVDLHGTLLNQFDRVLVTGNAQLDGRLFVGLAAGFNPALGTTFDILSTAFGMSGQFDVVDFANLPDGKAFHVDYLANTVRLTVVNMSFFAADFDEDGDVDQTDYSIWKNAFGLNQLGDANGDNISDAADYTIWRDTLGSVSGGAGSGGLGLAAVPEPGTVLLALVGMVATCYVRRRT